MKRSNLVDVVTEMIVYQFGCSDFVGHSMANNIINELEEQGMLPIPNWENAPNLYKFDDTYYNSKVFKWDKE